MAHSKEAQAKKPAMAQFNEGHWVKKESDVNVSDLKYTQGEMANPEHLKQSVNSLASYVKKNKMKH